MSRPLKIVVVVPDDRDEFRRYADPLPQFGPAPTALLGGFAQLPGECEVHVVCCVQKRIAAPEKIGPNIFYHAEVVPKLGWLRGAYIGCVRSVRRQLQKIQPDIVHGQGTERYCVLAAVFSGFPNVLTIHGNMAELARLFGARIGSYGWLAARLENVALPRASGVFCNSAYTESLVRPRAKKTWRVPNALRGEFFETAPEVSATPRDCILLNVGAITERKRQLELLDVAWNLRRLGLKFEFHFIGRLNPSDPYAAAFRERLKPLEAVGCARHFDELPAAGLVRRFDSADALVHFPSEEAFGLVVAEALARGLKFFGSQLGGIVDIAGGVPGAELFGHDDWDGLTGALAGWISQGRPRAAGAGAVMRGRYDPVVIARQHLEIYREVLDGPS